MASPAGVGAAERRIVVYTAATHSLVHILEWTYSALLVDIGDQYGAGFFLLGALSNVFSYAFGFAALPSGLLSDRLGSQRVLYLCLGGASLAAVLVGLSPNVWVLAVALAVLGLAIGLYHPAGISLIAQGVRQRGMALGLHGVAGNLGIAATPLLAVTFADAFRLAGRLLLPGRPGSVAGPGAESGQGSGRGAPGSTGAGPHCAWERADDDAPAGAPDPGLRSLRAQRVRV